ncbi:MAG: helix-hairpin-helix domain-containing protein [Thermodesulfobacteriota bacterium]|nr:helix-hairpin-helix domain-containing protein [Thermodesulfobacteriota bacterium]
MEEKKKEVKGTIAQIKFRNSDNWAVFSVSSEATINTITNCTGILPTMCDAGSEITCTGVFIYNKFGSQLKCEKIVPAPPDIKSDAGVIAILQRLPGIGKVRATKAVAKYGHVLAWKAANQCPSMLGITSIDKAMEAQEKARESICGFPATIYLLGLGLTDHQTNKIISIYGYDKALKQVSENPYRLISDIDGFGFRIVDKIALKAGVAINSDARIMACVLFCLQSSEHNEGNVWHWGKELVQIVLSELRESMMASACSMNGSSLPAYKDIRQCLYGLKAEGMVVIEDGKVFSAELLDAEKIIFGRLKNETIT